MPRFDAIADRYDQFRALPAGVPEAVREAVWGGVGRPFGRLLEVGAGTGRLGEVFAAACDDYTGADPSRPMLERFAAKFRGRSGLPLRLVQADGLALPFANRTFDAVLMVSVLSGVAGWRRMLDESRRLLRAGGALAIGRTVRPPDGIDARMKDQLASILARMGVDARRPGAGRDDAGDWLAREAGSHVRQLAARWESRRSPRDFLTRHPTGARFSSLPESIRNEAMGRLSGWALAAFSSLDAEVVEEHGFEIDIFTFGS